MRKKQSSILWNLSDKQIQVGAVLLFAFYVLVNLLRLGGDAFVINLNNTIVIPFALGVVVLAAMLWQKLPLGNQSRALWAGLTVGWGLWAVAELWWGVAALIGQEVPYPSWADFFWLLGYLPMYYVLWMRIRSLPAINKMWQKAGIWSSALITSGWAVFFVLIPILRANDSGALLESILNITYLIADLLLLIFVLQIFFSYQQGRYGRTWVWLSTGFIIHSLAGLFFSFASSANLYYPDGQVNLISTLGVDIPYNLSYALWVVGLLGLRNLQNIYIPFASGDIRLEPVPDTHIIISTGADGSIIDVSHNYGQIFSTDAVQGKTIQNVLGISDQEAKNIYAEIKTKKMLMERSVTVVSAVGIQQAGISGVVVMQQEYSGSLFLLRMFTQNNSVDEALSHYHKDILTSLLIKTGAKEKEEGEIRRLVSGYYLPYIKALYNRIFLEGGVLMADALLTDLQSVGQEYGWQVEIHPETFLEIRKSSLTETEKAFPLLLERAKQFVTRTIDAQTAQDIIQHTYASIDDVIHKNVERFEPAIIEHT